MQQTHSRCLRLANLIENAIRKLFGASDKAVCVTNETIHQMSET